MRLLKNTFASKTFRWTYIIPLACYGSFMLATWLFTVPLKPEAISNIAHVKNDLEDSFEIRIKNSNFNSDSNLMQTVDGKNEYLVNVNNAENSRKGQTEVLTEVFRQADKDLNEKLDSKELSQWIRSKIIQHISEAVGNNYGMFMQIDINPKNGVITWKEYHAYFLRRRGFSDEYVNGHDEKRHKGLKRTIKGKNTLYRGISCSSPESLKGLIKSLNAIEQIMRDRALWTESAKTNPDSLTVDEFLTFTHPESSVSNQLSLVDELYKKFDRDGDEFLTENEFAILQTEGADDETFVVRQDEQQRRHEFRTTVDLNGDGKADRRELLHYVAPQSPRHADHEAEALLSFADNDHDNMLSLDEILIHPDLFLKSKMIDTARSFHDEF